MPGEDNVNIYGLDEDGAVYYYHRDISKWRVLIPAEVDNNHFFGGESFFKKDMCTQLKNAAKDVIDDWNVTNDRNNGKLNWDSLHILKSVLTDIDK